MFLKNFARIAVSFFLVATPTIGQQSSPTESQSDAITTRERARETRLRQIKLRRLRLEQDLQLSQQQRELVRSIRQRHLSATRTKREQLFQLREKRRMRALVTEDRNRALQLRSELRRAMAATRQERLNVLTTEQRTRLQELREQ